jgi:hypothetical protein
MGYNSEKRRLIILDQIFLTIHVKIQISEKMVKMIKDVNLFQEIY